MASRSRRSSQPVSTPSTILRATMSITGRERTSQSSEKDVSRVVEHFYEAARQVTRIIVGDSMIGGQTSNERARPLNQPGDVRANGFTSGLIVKPRTWRGPSHFYARSAWHDIAPAHDTIRGRRRALYGTALDS